MATPSVFEVGGCLADEATAVLIPDVALRILGTLIEDFESQGVCRTLMMVGKALPGL